ncbi:MAG: hypothetical protein ABJG68_11700 [Crocinitomicaceae bacterium]
MTKLISFAFIFLILTSCGHQESLKDYNQTNAQEKLNKLLNLRINGMSFEESIADFYSNPSLINQETSNDSLVLKLTRTFSNHLVDQLMNMVPLKWAWNEDLLSAEIYEGDSLSNLTIDWVYDTTDCAENLFISEGNKLNQELYNCVCFDSTGLILSVVPLLNSDNLEIDWY